MHRTRESMACKEGIAEARPCWQGWAGQQDGVQLHQGVDVTTTTEGPWPLLRARSTLLCNSRLHIVGRDHGAGADAAGDAADACSQIRIQTRHE